MNDRSGSATLRWERRERGFVAVWLAIILVVLLGIAALAVDVVHGYQVYQSAQNAADAASLGGTVFLPGNPSEAASRAQSLAADNGFANGVDGATVVATQQPNPTQLRVVVTKQVDTWFAGALGFDTLTVRAEATADYDQPVAMGSPANTFGNQPDCSGTCTNVSGAETPQLWFNVAGPGSRKIRGDAILPSKCTAESWEEGAPLVTPDNCSGSNSDRDPAGYSYAIRNANAGGSLAIEVFDPAFVDVGDNCRQYIDDRPETDDPTALEQLHRFAVEFGSPDAARYQPGASSKWCTGDQWFWDDGGPNPPAPVTSYSIAYDPGTPWTTSDDVPQAGCSRSFGGFQGDLVLRLSAETSNPSLERTVTDYFRKWVTICTVNGAQQGDYVLRITTTVGSGHNRGSIRAKKNGSLTSSDVSIFARGRMSIYANADAASTEFYLARVLPGAAGRTLALKFFDTGDAETSGAITILPPTDATAGGGAPLTSFSGCTYAPPPGSATGPPWGARVNTGAGCSVSAVHKQYWNGQWIEWYVPIPAGYSCDYTDATKCWVKIRFAYPSGHVQDTTTWTASLDGNPVRIVD